MSSTEIDSNLRPTLPDTCPISTILSSRLTEMNDQELEDFVKSTRSALETPQSLSVLLKGKTRKPKITYSLYSPSTIPKYKTSNDIH